MLMKKMVLNNFRQYKGEQTIEFSDDPVKNVTLILGQNTSGKSTLVQAFRWVLYNDYSFSGKSGDNNSVLNKDVAKTMMPGDESESEVTLTIVHKGVEYDISRAYVYHSKAIGSAQWHSERFSMYYYDSNGERRLIDGEGKLKEILPQSLAEYFFFDGEKISQSRIASNVKDSINTIMGLVPLEHMMSHLNGNRHCVMNSLRASLRLNNSVASINAKIDRVTKEKEEAEKNKEAAFCHQKAALQQESDALVAMERIKDIAKDAAELKKVDKELDAKNNEIVNTESDIIKSFSYAMMESMLNLVSLDVRESLSSSKYEDKGVPGMDATAIHYLLKKGKCICGSDLSNEECKKQLLNLLTYLPPESIGSQINHLNSALKEFSTMKDKQDLFKFYLNNYEKGIKDYNNLDQRHDFLSSKVKGVTNADELANQYEAARKLSAQFQEQVVNCEIALKQKQDELTKLNSELAVASREDEYNAEIADKMEYVQALFDKAHEEYEKNSGDIFSEVRDTLTETFKSMYHGQRDIELTSDYKVRLSVGGEHLDNSKGLDTVQNFAFIASLVKVARSRVGSELSSESFPLVMDAVFSNTDGVHIRNICEVLPKLAEQSILAIMKKDWDIASDSLDNYVGKRYIIDKITETHSQIRAIKEGS